MQLKRLKNLASKAKRRKTLAQKKTLLGIILLLGIPVLAFILSLTAWNFNEQHPRTDDALARANLIGIAPRVSGPIVKLHVGDNQLVKDADPAILRMGTTAVTTIKRFTQRAD